MGSIAKQLRGGDRRSIGKADAVAAQVLKEPALFGELFEALLAEDPIVRMRAADAVEKVTAKNPELIRPHKRRLLGTVARIDQQEVRWHFAQIVPRLQLTTRERIKVVETLLGYLEDESAIVKTFALQALADLSTDDARLRRKVIRLCEEAVASGPKSMKNRARKLLGILNSD